MARNRGPIFVVGAGLALLAVAATRSGGSIADSGSRDPPPPPDDDSGPSLLPPDEPGPDGELPSVGSGPNCTAQWLALPRMNRRLGSYDLHGSPSDPDVLAWMNSAARAYVTPPGGKFIWTTPQGVVTQFKPGMTSLTPAGQVEAFKAARHLLLSQDYRSTIAVMTRRVLRLMMPECDWDRRDLWPAFGKTPLSADEYNLFVSVWYLVQAAARYVGITAVGGKEPWRHLMLPWDAEINDYGGPGLVIGRGYMGLQDWAPGFAIEPGRRVELVVGEYAKPEWPRPPFFHSEPVVARVISQAPGQGPYVEIVSSFAGQDVSPRFSNRHGFEAGRRLRLPGPGWATTAIYRVRSKGET
jgi:hypothetical protein